MDLAQPALNQLLDDFQTPDGLNRLRSLLRERLGSFEPYDWQLLNSLRVLRGQDLLSIAATGQGKSVLLWLPLVFAPALLPLLPSYLRDRPAVKACLGHPLAIGVAPSKIMRHDLAVEMSHHPLTAVEVNGATLEENEALWQQAQESTTSLLIIRSEQLDTDLFDKWLTAVKPRVLVLFIDDAHMYPTYAKKLSDPFQDFSKIRTSLPPQVRYIACTATLAPGPDRNALIDEMALRKDLFVDVHPIRRQHICRDFRLMKRSPSTSRFADLDWLIDSSCTSLEHIPKCLIFIPNIGNGLEGVHITDYLRSRLPKELKKDAVELVRHTADLTCRCCVSDTGRLFRETRETPNARVVVCEDLWMLGSTPPEVRLGIVWGIPGTLSTLQHHAGRLGRKTEDPSHLIFYCEPGKVKRLCEQHQKYLDRVAEVPGDPTWETVCYKDACTTRNSYDPHLARAVWTAFESDSCLGMAIDHAVYGDETAAESCWKCSNCLGNEALAYRLITSLPPRPTPCGNCGKCFSSDQAMLDRLAPLLSTSSTQDDDLSPSSTQEDDLPVLDDETEPPSSTQEDDLSVLDDETEPPSPSRNEYSVYNAARRQAVERELTRWAVGEWFRLLQDKDLQDEWCSYTSARLLRPDQIEDLSRDLMRWHHKEVSLADILGSDWDFFSHSAAGLEELMSIEARRMVLIQKKADSPEAASE